MSSPSSSQEHFGKVLRYKLIVLGDHNVGKTSIIRRFVNDTFDSDYQSTVGLDMVTSPAMIVGSAMVSLTLWDTTGQERFRSVMPSYFRDSSVAIVVYDVTQAVSFHQTSTWIDDVRLQLGEKVIVVLVGNKVDLNGSREVSTSEGEQKAKELGIVFMETSAKEGKNIKTLFERITQMVVHQNSTTSVPKVEKRILLRNYHRSHKLKKCCC